MKAMERGGLCDRLRENLALLSGSVQSDEQRKILLDLVYGDVEQLEIQLAWLHRGQQSIDERLAKIEQSLFFRILRWPGVRYARIRHAADRWLLRRDSTYQDWVTYEQRSLVPGREECLRRVAEFAHQPVITVVLAVREPAASRLNESIRSVTEQIYPAWELCICIDGPVNESLATDLARWEGSDAPVRIVRHTTAQGASAALNSACSLARGKYIGFLNQDDALSPHALYYVVEALQKLSPALLYSDEDTLSVDGRRTDPLFKPDWSPDLLISRMYLWRLLVVSSVLFHAAGGFRSTYDGAEDLDLCLRIVESDDRVTHIPRVLYHRLSPGRLSADAEAESATARALQDTIRRRGWNAKLVSGTAANTFRIQPATDRLVSIIICSRSPKWLRNVLSKVRKVTDYPQYEIVVTEHCPEGENPEMARLTSEYGCIRIPVYGPFNFSNLNNVASLHAGGSYLAFLNDDVEPLRADWLYSLCSHLERSEIGIAGGKLLYPSGAIQHAGVVVGIGDGAGHVNRDRYSGVYWKWTEETRDVSAVTGACLAIRTELFRQLDGFDTAFPNNYNDVDLCLRAGKAGYRVIYEPAALLRHYEGRTRKLFVNYEERERFYGRWHRILESGDPYYTPNLMPEGEEALLSLSIPEQRLEAR